MYPLAPELLLGVGVFCPGRGENDGGREADIRGGGSAGLENGQVPLAII